MYHIQHITSLFRMGTVINSNCTKRILKSKNLPPPTVPTIKGKSSFFEPKDEPKSTDTSSEENKNHAGPKVGKKFIKPSFVKPLLLG